MDPNSVHFSGWQKSKELLPSRRKVAVTGDPSSGKSTLCSFMRELGASIINTDAVVHELFSVDPHIIQCVIDLFGSDVCRDGQLVRREIARRAFSSPELLRALEELMHPQVMQVIQTRYADESASHADGLFCVEVPLLFEARVDFRSWFDVVVCVVGKRVRDETEYEDMEARVARQWGWAEKAALSDIVVENSGSLNAFRSLTPALMHQIRLWC